MGFLVHPLFPEKRVSLIAADERLKPEMKAGLIQQGVEVLPVPSCSRLHPAVSGHPDMQMVHLRDNILVCHPHISHVLVETLEKRGFEIHLGKHQLKRGYPMDIAYNVAIVGGVAFHHTKYTDSVLLEQMKKCDICLVHVRQGYSKCSVLPVSPESLITADPTISKAALEAGMDVLTIPPQVNIRLPHMNYGFIGGTAGFIDKACIAFAGSLESLDSIDVERFLKKHGVQWMNLGENEIVDYGGFIPLYEE